MMNCVMMADTALDEVGGEEEEEPCISGSLPDFWMTSRAFKYSSHATS